MSTYIDFDKRYRHPDYPGVAWYIEGYRMDRDADYEWSGIETEDVTQVRAVMVGDDRTFLFDTEDMIALSDDEYCPECGQIGCKGGRLE
jgi:hypothetical protein